MNPNSISIENPNFESLPGDILYGTNNRNIQGPRPHYMIYLGQYKHPEYEFLGAMLTHYRKGGNIPLKKAFFVEFQPSGRPWRVKFDILTGSFIANELLRKLVDWKPFIKVGQLTPEGLVFVRQRLENHQPQFSPWNAPN